MSHVFISYSKKNKDYAVQLVNKLRDEGFDVWIDDRQLRSSEDWWSSIVSALWGCAAFVVILTPDSDASRWVQREIMLADQRSKPIFPLWLAGSLDTPNWSMLVRIEHEDVRGGKLPPPEFFEQLAQYSPRKPQRGENITTTGKLNRVPVNGDDDLAAAIQNPPETDEDEVVKPLSAPMPRSHLLMGVLLALLTVAALGLLVAPTLLPPAITPTLTKTQTVETETVVLTPAPSLADIENFNIWRQEQGYAALVENTTLKAVAERHLSYLSSVPLDDLSSISLYHNREGRDAQAMAADGGYLGQVEMFVTITDADVTLDDLLSMIEMQGSADVEARSREVGLAQERSLDTNKLYYVLILGSDNS
ncbi:MAG TPA: toll/interleukin-1 receptor domain-containing protein [Phototrophicaceae bacterium]|nr:toll/interleukin-1 receptor domain-containing protein [Phototrophicaceae bacterium]